MLRNRLGLCLLAAVVAFSSCNLKDLFAPDTQKDTTIDSDGDGYTDDEEINTFKFNPANNPLKFNPYIADLPQIGFEITSLPVITLNLTKTNEATTSATLDYGSTSSIMTSTSQSSAVAIGLTRVSGIKLGLTVEKTTKVNEMGWTVEGSFEWNREVTQNREVTTTVSNEAQQARETSLNQIFTETTLNSRTIAGGDMTISLDIVNNGYITFALNSITLIASYVDPEQNYYKFPLGSLTLNLADYIFGTPIAPKGSIKATATWETEDSDLIGTLMATSNNIVIELGSYHIVDANGKAYAFDRTEVDAKTCNLLIDYGAFSPKAPEFYKIAPDFAGGDSISLKAVFRDLLRADYALADAAGDNSLAAVRGHRASLPTGCWLIFHYYSAGGTGIYDTKMYWPSEAYTFEDIVLNRGDSIVIAYVEDGDGDGLLASEELRLGTSDGNSDTDGDGMGDFLEAQDPSRNPAINESKINDAPQLPASVSGAKVSGQTESSVTLAWTKPASADGVIIVRSTSALTKSPSHTVGYSVGNAIGNGTVVYAGNGATYTDAMSDVVYFYSIFSYKRPSYDPRPLYSTGAALVAVPNAHSATASLSAAQNAITVNGAKSLAASGTVIARSTSDLTSLSLAKRTGGYVPGDVVSGATIVYKSASSQYSHTAYMDMDAGGSDSNYMELANDTVYFYKVFSYATVGSVEHYSSGTALASVRTWCDFSVTLGSITVQDPLDGESRDGHNAEFYWKAWAETPAYSFVFEERSSVENFFLAMESETYPGVLRTFERTEPLATATRFFHVDPASPGCLLRFRGYMREKDGTAYDEYIADTASYYQEYWLEDFTGGAMRGDHRLHGWLRHDNGKDYNICDINFKIVY
jgi:hypothetical protein